MGVNIECVCNFFHQLQKKEQNGCQQIHPGLIKHWRKSKYSSIKWVFTIADPVTGQRGEGQEKIYAAVFVIYLFYDLFVLGKGEGDMPPPAILYWLI